MRSNRFTGTSAEASERIDHLKKSIEDGLIVWFEGVEKTECGNERCVDSVLASSLGALLGYSQGLWQFTKAAKAGGHGGSTELQSFENNLRTIRERIDRIALELFVAIPETVRSTDVRLSSLKADSQSLFQLVAQSAVLLKNDEEKLQQMLATEDADLEAARRDRQTRNADAERSVLDARQGVQHAEQAQASRQDLTSTVYSVWKWAVGIAIAWQTTKQGSLFNAIIPFLVWLGVAWLSRRPALPFVSAIIAGLRGSATPAQALARLGAVEAEAVLARASLNKDDAVAVQRRDANKKMLRQVFEKSRETLFAKIDGAVTHTQVGAQSLQRDIALAASGELSAKQSRARVELRRRVDQARVDLKQLRKVLGLDANKNENGPRIFREMSRQAMIVGESIAILPAEVAKVWGNQTISVPRVIRPELPCLVVGSMASREPGSSEKLASAILFGVLKATPPSELVITIFDPSRGSAIGPFLPLVESGLSSAPEMHLAGSRKAFDACVDTVLDQIQQANVALAKSKIGHPISSDAIGSRYKQRWHVLVIYAFPTELDRQIIDKLVILADAVKGGHGALLVSYEDDFGRPLEEYERKLLSRLEPLVGRDGIWELSPIQPQSDSDIGKAIAEGCGHLSHQGEEARERDARSGIDAIFKMDYSRSSAEGLEFEVGVDDGGRLTRLRFDFDLANNSAVLIGQPGSGKTNLLHVLILNGVLHYSPLELQLYLFDFKEGLDFHPYAKNRLPHAAVVSLGSDRNFVLNCLREIESKFRRRADAFAGVGSTKLAEYRAAQAKQTTEARMYAPRVLVVIDEFQELFTGAPSQAKAAEELLEHLARKGRSYGYHLILSTQNLGGAARLPAGLLRLLTIKVAMKSDPNDVASLLGNERIASELKNRGDAAISPGNFGKPFNIFHSPEVTRERREAVLRQVTRRFGVGKNLRTFDGQHPPVIGQNLIFIELSARLPRAESEAGAVPILLGEPLSTQPVARIDLRCEPRQNILTIAQNREDIQAIWLAILWSLSTLNPERLAVTLLLPQGRYRHVESALKLPALLAMHIEVARDLPAQIHALSVLSSCAPSQSRHFVFVADPTLLNWPQGARGPAMALRPHPPGADPDPDPRDLLTALVTDGPERGIHVLSFFEGLAKIQPMLGREFPSHFAFKVTGRIDEYEARIGLGDASVTALRAGQFIVRDELSTGDAVQFQGFSPGQPPENPGRIFDK